MISFSAQKFAVWLQSSFEESTFKSYTELAEAAGSSKQTISRLATAGKQTLTDKPSRPREDLVISLAKALNKPIEEALQAAGYALPSDEFESEIQTHVSRLAEGIMASGVEDLEDVEARESFFSDLHVIAETMLKERLKRQIKRKNNEK